MYLHTTKVKRANGRVDEYIRLVKAYWNHGHPSHRVIYSLGRKDLLAPHADTLMQILGSKGQAGCSSLIQTWDWGPMLVARHLWRQLGMEEIADAVAEKNGGGAEIADRVLVLATYRLCRSKGVLGFSYWLETNFVCDRFGRRWLPGMEKDEMLAVRNSGKSGLPKSQKWQRDRTLDTLTGLEQEIRASFLKMHSLSSTKNKMLKLFGKGTKTQSEPEMIRIYAAVSWLAVCLDRELQRNIKSAGIRISAREAWELLKTLRIVSFVPEEKKRVVANGHAMVRKILDVLSIEDLSPVSAEEECESMDIVW
jgi:hypothetical protein